ncbi:hypothetical protein KAZ66_02245 [Candidatus Woesebacteria bacterium]|nr:hypothetical protein [Candidatus Woesebacteria bacterium]
MAVINNAAPTTDNNSGMGFLFGVILLIVFMFFLFYFGLPAIQNSIGGGTQINVPDKVDINVKQAK